MDEFLGTITTGHEAVGTPLASAAPTVKNDAMADDGTTASNRSLLKRGPLARRVKPIVAKLAGGMLSLTIASALMVGLQGKTAHAADWSNTGHPGTVQIPVEQARINVYPASYPQLIFPSRFAWRSSSYSTSTQVISVKYAILRWDLSTRSWPLYAWASAAVTVPVGYSGGWLGSWSPGVAIMSDYFVEAMVSWKTTGGTVIGTTTIVYDSTTDYQCLTSGCSRQPDPIVGAYVYLAF